MMEIRCPGCSKMYGLPEEKIPAGKTVAFRCPQCGAPITLHPPEEADVFEIADTPEESEPGIITGSALKNRILHSLGDLPVMPQVVPLVQEILADPNAVVDDLVRIIEADQGAAAMVLKLTNSAYYGLRGDVSSIKQAAVLLGFETLGKFILMAGASTLLDKGLKGYIVESGSLWGHSLHVAFLSKLLARRCDSRIVNDAFLAGLIHDIGKIILDDHVVKNKAVFASVEHDNPLAFLLAEQETFGFDHAELGYDACVNWNFPETLTLPIKYHHQPDSSAGLLSHIIYAANAIALVSNKIQDGIMNAEQAVEQEILRELDLQEDDLGLILTEAEKSVNELTEKLGAG